MSDHKAQSSTVITSVQTLAMTWPLTSPVQLSLLSLPVVFYFHGIKLKGEEMLPLNTQNIRYHKAKAGFDKLLTWQRRLHWQWDDFHQKHLTDCFRINFIELLKGTAILINIILQKIQIEMQYVISEVWWVMFDVQDLILCKILTLWVKKRPIIPHLG